MAEIEANGVRTYYEKLGSGTPLVLAHGLGGSTELWKHVAGPLAEDFHVVLYDLRGSGRSEVAPGPYSLGQLVADLDGLIEALGLGRVLLMGHSMSGTLALAYAAAHPQTVLGVVGVGAPSEIPDAGREGLRARAATVESQGMAAVAETVATNGMAPSFREAHPDEFRAFIQLIESNDPRGYGALCRVVADLDVTGDLGGIQAPVLLVAGDRDAVAPPAASEKTAAAIPNARYVQVEDCAHILPWEKPVTLLEAARPFLLAAAVMGVGA